MEVLTSFAKKFIELHETNSSYISDTYKDELKKLWSDKYFHETQIWWHSVNIYMKRNKCVWYRIEVGRKTIIIYDNREELGFIDIAYSDFTDKKNSIKHRLVIGNDYISISWYNILKDGWIDLFSEILDICNLSIETKSD